MTSKAAGELRQALLAFPELDGGQRERVVAFYLALIAENEVQNLTRLTSPTDFVEGHIMDVLELQRSGFLGAGSVFMDLGSGCGVPGLLYALLFEGVSWILAESEGSKAAFLAKTALDLGISNVTVHAGRGEEYLRTKRVDGVVARAVGKLPKIYTWIGNCSTWNSLILFKGPSWDEELKEWTKARGASKLESRAEHRYEVGQEKKKRVLVNLARVPRGTKNNQKYFR